MPTLEAIKMVLVNITARKNTRATNYLRSTFFVIFIQLGRINTNNGKRLGPTMPQNNLQEARTGRPFSMVSENSECDFIMFVLDTSGSKTANTES